MAFRGIAAPSPRENPTGPYPDFKSMLQSCNRHTHLKLGPKAPSFSKHKHHINLCKRQAIHFLLRRLISYKPSGCPELDTAHHKCTPLPLPKKLRKIPSGAGFNPSLCGIRTSVRHIFLHASPVLWYRPVLLGACRRTLTSSNGATSTASEPPAIMPHTMDLIWGVVRGETPLLNVTYRPTKRTMP